MRGSWSGATWIVLGAGSILPRAGFGPAGYALELGRGGGWTLFDCGPGTLRASAEAGLEFERLERVVVSHLHPDHCLDLFALAFARRNPNLDPPPLEIIGPEGLSELLADPPQVWGRWVSFTETTVIERAAAAAQRPLERPGLLLSCAPTHHTPESLAWRADLSAGGSVVFSGDAVPGEELVALAAGCELFCCEASFPDERPGPGHLTPRAAADLAAKAGCGRLLLSHFYPQTDPERAARAARAVFSGPVETARDGSRHPLGVHPADAPLDERR